MHRGLSLASREALTKGDEAPRGAFLRVCGVWCWMPALGDTLAPMAAQEQVLAGFPLVLKPGASLVATFGGVQYPNGALRETQLPCCRRSWFLSKSGVGSPRQ
jgi:hypothetical protein